MEQEPQKKKMVDESGHESLNAPPMLCTNNCGFFGNPSTNNLCSKCYKDYLLKQSKIASIIEENKVVGENTAQVGGVEDAKVDEGTTSENRPANRCSFCRKRVGLTAFKCRCGQTFCSIHRYSDKHNCLFDYKSARQDAIAKENPVIRADKVEKI